MEKDLFQSRESPEGCKKAIKDVYNECNEILEFDRRISTICHQIDSVSKSVNEDKAFIQQTCEELRPIYKNIEKTSRILNKLDDFRKLNNSCRRADNFLKHTDRPMGEDHMPIGIKMLEDFERVYKQFEPILSNRSDLPYHKIALELRKRFGRVPPR